MSREVLSNVADRFFEGMKDDLSAQLDEMKVEDADIRDAAMKLALNATRVAFLEMAGEDVELEKAALASSAQSLKAAGMIVVAERMRTVIAQTFVKVLTVALQVAVAL